MIADLKHMDAIGYGANSQKNFTTMQRMELKLYHADAFEVLPKLEPGSFDAVIADPPDGAGCRGHREDGR